MQKFFQRKEEVDKFEGNILNVLAPLCPLKGRSFPSSAYYTSKGILRFAKPHSINLSTTFLPTRLCTRRSPEQHLQGRFKNEMMTFYCKIIANGIGIQTIGT